MPNLLQQISAKPRETLTMLNNKCQCKKDNSSTIQYNVRQILIQQTKTPIQIKQNKIKHNKAKTKTKQKSNNMQIYQIKKTKKTPLLMEPQELQGEIVIFIIKGYYS